MPLCVPGCVSWLPSAVASAIAGYHQFHAVQVAVAETLHAAGSQAVGRVMQTVVAGHKEANSVVPLIVAGAALLSTD
ncbi:MAG TPA: hypothetical protein PLQ12_07990 [Candidatus Defluviicoccus seviourii]|nr:hypothetical protein [Candidatus Defluviicoccus seviourii]